MDFSKILAPIEFVELWIRSTSIALLLIIAIAGLWLLTVIIRICISKHRLDSLVDQGGQNAIWLIHGTFAENADWCSTGSDFFKQLRESCPNSSISSFKWTGINSTIARNYASVQLKSKIEHWANTSTQEKLTLVGHSHAGTIALYARYLVAKEIACKVEITCLSTPIILRTAQRSKWQLSADLIVTSLILGYSLAVLILASCGMKRGELFDSFLSIPNAFIAKCYPTPSGLPNFEASVSMVVILIYICVVIFVLWVSRRLIARNIRSNVPLDPELKSSTWFARLPGDEVSGLARIFHQ